MKEYPWRGSRKTIKDFLEKEESWYIDIPNEMLTSMELEKLYKKNSPSEFVPYDLLASCFDHANCDRKILNEAFEKLIEMRNGLDACLAVLALRTELDTKKLEKLARFHFHEDSGEHAIGTLICKAREKDRRARKALDEILSTDFNHKAKEIVKYISNQLFQSKVPKKSPK